MSSLFTDGRPVVEGDDRAVKDARATVAQLWSGVESLLGISSELVHRVSLYRAALWPREDAAGRFASTVADALTAEGFDIRARRSSGSSERWVSHRMYPGSAAGLVYVGIGDNQVLGGNNKIQGNFGFNFPLVKATVEIDGKVVVKEGRARALKSGSHGGRWRVVAVRVAPHVIACLAPPEPQKVRLNVFHAGSCGLKVTLPMSCRKDSVSTSLPFSMK